MRMGLQKYTGDIRRNFPEKNVFWELNHTSTEDESEERSAKSLSSVKATTSNPEVG